MVALNTTKRKFAKLLDNLTSPSTPSSHGYSSQSNSTSSFPSRAEPPTKRSRLSTSTPEDENDPSTPRASNQPTFFSRSHLSTRTHVDNSTTSGVRSIRSVPGNNTSPSSIRKTPNYAPWSQEQFLERLKSFSDVKLWSSKPDRVSEVHWAKRGWVLDGWNKVACKGGCEQRLSIRLRPKRKDADGEEVDQTEDELFEVDEGLLDRYEDMIETSHSDTCLWRKAGCKSDIYHMPLARRDNCERGLKERYDSLLAIGASLPPLDSLSFPDGEEMDDLIASIPASIYSSADSTPSRIAAMLSLHGWSGILQSTLPLLLCNCCFQRVGLWMYTAERLKSMSASLDVPITHLRLKVLDQHRDNCPWRNAVSQANPAASNLRGLNASETLIATLRRNGSKTSSRPQTPVVRDQLETNEDLDGLSTPTLTAAALEKQDRERLTKWRKLKARMSFKRPKSSSGKSMASTNGDKSVHQASTSRPQTPGGPEGG